MNTPIITIDEARAFYEGSDSAHDFEHILRVLTLAEKIARAEGADLNVVRTAALLHDMARADEDRAALEEDRAALEQTREGKNPGEAAPKLDHAELSAEKAHALLQQKGAGEEFATRVAEAIRAHRFRGTRRPDSLEGQILFDADKLDSIGAIGVARAYAIAGALNQKLYTETNRDAVATRAQHNSDHSPVAEFHVKLSKLRGRFHTATARALAEERHAFMVEFFERLGSEVLGEK